MSAVLRTALAVLSLVATAMLAPTMASAVPPSAGCRAAPGGGLTLANVAAHGQRLVAVGSNGLIATSTGGERWTVRRTTTTHDLRGVTWTGDRWVVVGDVGTILSSADGITWKQASGIPNEGLRAVAALPGLVVAAGANGTILRSTDGERWTTVLSGTTDALWGAVADPDGHQILLSGQDALVLASTDGSVWTPRLTNPLPTDSQDAPRPFLWQLGVRGDRTVAVGDFGALLLSLTGGPFQGLPDPSDEILRGVAASLRTFVAVGSGGTLLRATAAGSRWQTSLSPTTADLRGVAWTGTRFVAVGDQSTVVSSADGIHWRTEVTAMPCALLSVAAGPERYVAVGGHGAVATSADGRAWTTARRPTTEDLYGAAHGTPGYVAVGAGGTVLTSPDGRTGWTRRRSGTTLNLHTVVRHTDEYLAGGDRGRVLRSRDGRRWTRVPFPGFHSVRGFAAAGSTVVAAGAGTIARRGPGGRWALLSIGFRRFQTGVAAGNGRFVVVGHNGSILTSLDDGRTWTPQTSGVSVNLDAVIWTGTRFLSTGEGVAITSPDGETWTPAAAPSDRSTRALGRRGAVLVAVGDGRTVRRSTDGGTRWTAARLRTP